MPQVYRQSRGSDDTRAKRYRTLLHPPLWKSRTFRPPLQQNLAACTHHDTTAELLQLRSLQRGATGPASAEDLISGLPSPPVSLLLFLSYCRWHRTSLQGAEAATNKQSFHSSVHTGDNGQVSYRNDKLLKITY